MNQSSCLWAEPPVNHLVLRDFERDWQTRVATSCLPIWELLQNFGPSGWFGKTCPVSCRLTAGGILAPSSQGWANSGMGSHTEFWTLNTSEFNHTLEPCLNDDGVCSLSDVLEAGNVQPQYFLSEKACAGILLRAERPGKSINPALLQALRQLQLTAAEP